MANTKSNALTKNYRGKFGNQFVFRNRNGKSIMAALPVRTADSVTEAQQTARKNFANAARYAKQILLDPDMLAAYMAKANTNGQSPYIIALTDYLRHPWIDEINLEAFNGNAGDVIRVMAGDDFKVAEVTVKILDPLGVEIESGTCALDTLGIWWEYTTTQAVTIEPGLEILAKARDIPGHSGESSYIEE
ncbi:hypothetical protein D4S03_01385 [bacterium]|nr:MAG: hypothetical protein D4S03_01385 [bacterium]